MPTIPQSHRDLVEAPVVASLCTVGGNGTPQVTAIWFVYGADIAGECAAKVQNRSRAPARNAVHHRSEESIPDTRDSGNCAGRKGPPRVAFREGISALRSGSSHLPRTSRRAGGCHLALHPRSGTGLTTRSAPAAPRGFASGRCGRRARRQRRSPPLARRCASAPTIA